MIKGAGYELSFLELLKICLRCEASCEEAMPQASLTKKNEADEAYFQSPKGSPKMSDFFRFFRRLILCINLLKNLVNSSHFWTSQGDEEFVSCLLMTF